MTRKLRLWVCPCCKCAWSRTKSENYLLCGRCNKECRAARTWPKRPARCKCQRLRDQMTDFKDRYWLTPRLAGMMKLRPTRELSKLWRSVRMAKTKQSVVRRAQKFVDALAAHSRQSNYAPGSRQVITHWTMSPKLTDDGRFEIRKHAGGWCGAPKVILKQLFAAHGTFARSLVHGEYAIYLDPRNTAKNHGAVPLDNLRGTLIHEVLHLVDSLCDVDCEGHNHRWAARLSVMEKMFTPYERKPKEQPA